MARVLLFGPVRQAAGVDAIDVAADTVGAALDELGDRYGTGFSDLLGTCRFWVDGEPAEATDPITGTSELSVLPPVSGG